MQSCAPSLLTCMCRVPFGLDDRRATTLRVLVYFRTAIPQQMYFRVDLRRLSHPNLLGVAMFKSHSNRVNLALLAGAVIALGACAKKEAATSDTGAAATADTGIRMADTAVASARAPAPALTDANIVYILDTRTCWTAPEGQSPRRKAQTQRFARSGRT